MPLPHQTLQTRIATPLCVALPCHRVLGADGRLTGYAGGLERKAALLRLEGALPFAGASAP